MPEEPQPTPVPAEEPPPHPAEPLQIFTPVIDIRKPDHKSGTHASNKGARLPPKIDSADARDFAREDEEALDAIEKFEKSLNRQLPG